MIHIPRYCKSLLSPLVAISIVSLIGPCWKVAVLKYCPLPLPKKTEHTNKKNPSLCNYNPIINNRPAPEVTCN